MWSSLRRLLTRAVESRGATAFVVASLAVGTLVGAGTSLLVWGIAGVSRLAAQLRNDVGLGAWAVLVTVPLGLFVSWALNRRFGPGIEGAGVDATMVGVALRAGYLPTRTIGAKIAATAATLGAGGSAGREGPVVQIGATIGSSFARYTRFGEDQIRGLVAAGAAAGIAASFNAPIAGMLFAVEVIIGGFAIRHLNAVVVASVAAAVTAQQLVGVERLLSSPSHQLGHPTELALYAVLGLVAFGAGLLFLRTADNLAVIEERWPGWVRPIAVGTAVAALIVLVPELYGTGQSYLNQVLRLGPDSGAVALSLAIIAALKILSSLLTRAGGGAGGTMMPSLVIGGSLGAALAILLEPVWSISSLDPGAFAVVGMAATFAATARAPLTAVLLVFEVTGDYNLVLPLMLAAALATFLADRYHPDSIYTLPLRRRGIHLTTMEDIDLLDTVTVGEVMSPVDTELRPTMSVAEAAAELDRLHHHGLPVVAAGKLCGIVTVSDLAEPLLANPQMPLGEAMTAKPITVSPALPVSTALARMAALGVGRLPVVSDELPGTIVGMFRRESVVRAYHHALGATTDRRLYRERLKQRTAEGAAFFELPVHARSAAQGRRVRELPWPEEATLVSVRRGGSVLIPHGDTLLAAGDTITAFGTSEARVELAYLVEPAAGGEGAAATEPGATR